jgi:hypothetical protein
MRLISDGKELAAPRLVVNEGEKASIVEELNNKKTEIQCIAKEINNSISVDVSLQTEETDGTNRTLHSGKFLLNLTADQKTAINFQKNHSSLGNFISVFEITARRPTRISNHQTIGLIGSSKLTELK